MLTYNRSLKSHARKLRCQMTDAEQKLWYHLRSKQILETILSTESNRKFHRRLLRTSR